MEDDAKEVSSISKIDERDTSEEMERVQSLFDTSGSDSSKEVDQTFSQDSSVMSQSARIRTLSAVLEEEEIDKAIDECPSEEDDHFELQPTLRHANSTSSNPFHPRNGDADSDSLLEDEGGDCWRLMPFDRVRHSANSNMSKNGISTADPASRGQDGARNNGKMKFNA